VVSANQTQSRALEIEELKHQLQLTSDAYTKSCEVSEGLSRHLRVSTTAKPPLPFAGTGLNLERDLTNILKHVRECLISCGVTFSWQTIAIQKRTIEEGQALERALLKDKKVVGDKLYDMGLAVGDLLEKLRAEKHLSSELDKEKKAVEAQRDHLLGVAADQKAEIDEHVAANGRLQQALAERFGPLAASSLCHPLSHSQRSRGQRRRGDGA
jgi:hypothetical protein